MKFKEGQRVRFKNEWFSEAIDCGIWRDCVENHNNYLIMGEAASLSSFDYRLTCSCSANWVVKSIWLELMDQLEPDLGDKGPGFKGNADSREWFQQFMRDGFRAETPR